MDLSLFDVYLIMQADGIARMGSVKEATKHLTDAAVNELLK